MKNNTFEKSKRDIKYMLDELLDRGTNAEYLNLAEAKLAIGREAKNLLEILIKIEEFEDREKIGEAVKIIKAKKDIPA